MMLTRQKGQKGEDIAAAYLISKNYEIIRRNYRSKEGEIDIIAADGKYIVFVEVKLRDGDLMGTPAEAVTISKMKKISYTAGKYLSDYDLYESDVRFDVIEVQLESGGINHIENAFESYVNYEKF